jgi:hypothetical protein|tara:strand:- start:637 stop:1026 length:390 start_codon:yes stop_codon:yes gene_type:complete
VISKKKLTTIVKRLAQNDENKTSLFFFTSVKKLNPKKKENLIIIFDGKKKILNFFSFFIYAISSGIKFKKNSFLLFHLKNQLIGHNFVPDWPGAYFNQGFGKNMFIWFKKVIYILVFRKKLILIFTKIN